jgi:hypothetical protein
MKPLRVLIASLMFLAALAVRTTAQDSTLIRMDDAKFQDWLTRWQGYVTVDSRNRYCDKENGEELAWLVGPYLDGYYHGYLATKDPQWVDQLVDWTDSWVKRGVKEPDGFIGWPKTNAAGTEVDELNSYNADSLLGEAVALRPVVLMSREILRTPALRPKYGDKAKSYLKLAEQTYEKWDRRGVWRETAGGGMISIVEPYGIEAGHWTEGYNHRKDPGISFSHPDNKANLVARWLLAMSDATGKSFYKARAAKWFTLMKLRMTIQTNGTYRIWNYWQPAGQWDYLTNGAPKHWIGVHPNGGYYEIDTFAIVDAYEHHVVFTKPDVDRLIATALAEKRDWPALAPYNVEIQKHFEDSLKPDSWSGLTAVPWYLSLQVSRGERR